MGDRAVEGDDGAGRVVDGESEQLQEAEEGFDGGVLPDSVDYEEWG